MFLFKSDQSVITTTVLKATSGLNSLSRLSPSSFTVSLY